jgi:hypothetical protein
MRPLPISPKLSQTRDLGVPAKWGWPGDAQRSAYGLETRGCRGRRFGASEEWRGSARGGLTFLGAAPGAGVFGIEGRCREVTVQAAAQQGPSLSTQDGAGGVAV